MQRKQRAQILGIQTYLGGDVTVVLKLRRQRRIWGELNVLPILL